MGANVFLVGNLITILWNNIEWYHLFFFKITSIILYLISRNLIEFYIYIPCTYLIYYKESILYLKFILTSLADLRLGRNVGKSLFEYYKQVSVITVPVKTTDGRRGKKGRRHKTGKLKYRRPKPSPTPTQHFLEPRLFTPHIIRPDFQLEVNSCANITQNASYEHPAIQTRVHPKKATNQKHVYQEDDNLAVKYNCLDRVSPPPCLSIINLNSTIRNGLIDSLNNERLRNKLSSVEERSSKKKRLLREQINVKADFYSSEDEI